MTKPLFCLALLCAAGCASAPDTRLAQSNCRVYPATPASASGRAPRNVDPLEQRHAEMQLASSQLRQSQLQTRGPMDNLIEDVLRDCAARAN